MAEKTAIRQLIKGADGKTQTVYIDSKTKKRITNLKGYKIVGDTPTKVGEKVKEDKKPTKGFAVPLLVRGPDGLNRTIYVDPATGNEVDPKDRQVNDQFSQSLDAIGLKPTKEETPKAKAAAAGEEEKVRKYEIDDQRNNQNATFGKNDGTSDSMNDNYGYMDKPGWMGLTSFAPGPLGMMGKAANMAINASNTAATNKARQAIGLEKKSVVGGAFRDKKGYIGDITYDATDGKQGVTSPVSFEASVDGRTALTANEARMRSMLNGAKEATSEEKKQNEAAFKKENPRSLIDRVFGSVKDGVSDLKDSLTPSQKKDIKSEPARSNTYSQGPVNANVSDPDMPSRQMSDIQYDMGKRSEIPSSGIDKKVQDIVTDTLGPGYSVELYSGQEPAGAEPVGTKDRHPKGFAGDFRIRDPDGQPLSLDNPQEAQALHDVAQNFAGRYGGNIGIGKGYMGPSGMHMDTMPLGGEYPGGPQWGATGKQWAGDLEKARSLGVMADSYYDVDAPTPAERPGAVMGESDLATIGPAAATASVDVGRASLFSPQAKELMAKTLAGEIDPRSTDLSTPDGMREAQGIMSTMENRAPKAGGIVEGITAPDQYSTWSNPKAAATAETNYAANPGVFDGLVENYAKNGSQNLGFTSYYNPAIADPGWGAKMVGTTNIGPHKFGTLPEYGTFGKNFGQTGMTKQNLQTPVGPTPASAGTAAVASTSVNMKSPSTPSTGFSGSVADENANRGTSTSTSTGSTNRGSTTSPSSTGGLGSSGSNRGGSSSTSSMSSSTGSTGGFGVGGDRSSEGKSSYGGSGTGSLSSSTGSTGGFGVGGDRSSTGKSSTGGSSTGSKGKESRSDGWT